MVAQRIAAGVEPHLLVASEELPCCTWEVFARFVHHMRHVARMVAYTKTFKHQIGKLRRPPERGAADAQSAAPVHDPHGEALWEIHFDRDWETKLNARRRRIGPEPVPHPDHKHLLGLPQRDVGAETTDEEEEDDGELGGRWNNRADYRPTTEQEPEPEPEPETAQKRGSRRGSGLSSDDDDLL